VVQSSANNVLDVLRNDFALPRTPGGLTIVSVDKTGLKGGLTLSGPGAGNFLFYSALPGFIGTEQFTYICSDRYGNIGSNTVTVNVGALLTHSDLFSVLSHASGNELGVRANGVFFSDASRVRLISGFGIPDRGG